MSKLEQQLNELHKRMDLEKLQKAQLQALWKSITNNYIFFLALFFCLYKFKQSNKHNSSYLKLFATFIVIGTFGHFSHYISHHINFTEFYSKCDNILTRNTYSNYVITQAVNFLDFHDKIHHDTSINKHIKNICLEFLNNVYMQGFSIVILIKTMDIRVILLWTFMYATIHNINYLYIKPSTHQGHHINSHTNYGIDYMDIILNTKYDFNDIETHNHAAINLLVITYIITYITERWDWL